MSDELHVAVRDHVAYVTIDRPQRRNALSIGLTAELARALIALDDDDEVRAISLTATGTQAFCAGTDLKEADERARAGLELPRPMRGVDRNLFEVLLEVGKPTIAAVNGPAMAAGCELVLCCDLRVAAEHAWLALPEAKRGMGANFASVLLPRVLPRAIAFEMLYTGAPLSAEEALRWGLYNRVVPSDEVGSAAEELVRQVVANAPLTLRRYKHVATKTWSMALHEALRADVGPDPYGSADRVEGIRAFIERRAPRWEGR